jgi:hypothetical protein
LRNQHEFWRALFSPWPPKTESVVDWRHHSVDEEISEKRSSGIHPKQSKREEDPSAIHTRTDREFRVTLAVFSVSVLETEGVERFIDAAFAIVNMMSFTEEGSNWNSSGSRVRKDASVTAPPTRAGIPEWMEGPLVRIRSVLGSKKRSQGLTIH